MHLGKEEKLGPKCIGPFETLERRNKLTYKINPIFGTIISSQYSHISMLEKYMHNPLHVIEYEPIEACENMTYEEKPV